MKRLYWTIALMLGCGGGGGGGSAPVPATTAVTPPTDAVQWARQPDIRGICCNYTPLVVVGANSIRVYSNSDGLVDGDWWLREGTPAGVGAPRRVLTINSTRDRYIRTSAVVRDPATGKWTALLYTGDGYPTQGGYSPSLATSNDGDNWIWHGPVSPYGRNQSSAAALVVAPDGLRAWLDVGGGIRGMRSSDGGATWADEPQTWPAEIAGDGALQFVSAARTAYGYHLIGAVGFPAQARRHLWSCDGKAWRLLEADVPAGGEKGVNLTHDNGTVYALSGGGMLWTFPAKPFPCP